MMREGGEIGIEETITTKTNVIYKDFSLLGFLPIAEDPKSKTMLEVAKKAAKSKATVLLTGETGVGKEVLAHFIHHHSICKEGPFVSVNCAALPDNMIEAILFGYERGAFTSAINQYIGKFEQAHHGTLLLDEISEIPLSLQAKLLRVLQEREIERLGGKRIIHVDVRIIATTNRDLQQQVNAGLFRKDLFYRLNVLPIHCLSLRERTLDIIPLANYFLAKYAHSMERRAPTLTVTAQDKLRNYIWPGNIREMENIMQRSLVMTDNDMIDANDIVIPEGDLENEVNVDAFHQLDSKLAAGEAKLIVDVLRETNGCRNLAAKKLNISPRTLRYKLSKLKSIGIKIP